MVVSAVVVVGKVVLSEAATNNHQARQREPARPPVSQPGSQLELPILLSNYLTVLTSKQASKALIWSRQATYTSLCRTTSSVPRSLHL